MAAISFRARIRLINDCPHSFPSSFYSIHPAAVAAAFDWKTSKKENLMTSGRKNSAMQKEREKVLDVRTPWIESSSSSTRIHLSSVERAESVSQSVRLCPYSVLLLFNVLIGGSGRDEVERSYYEQALNDWNHEIGNKPSQLVGW